MTLCNLAQASVHPDRLYLVAEKYIKNNKRPNDESIYIDNTIKDPFTRVALNEIVKDSVIIRSCSYNENTKQFFFKYSSAPEFLDWYWQRNADNFMHVRPSKELIDLETRLPIDSFALYNLEKKNKRRITIKKIEEYVTTETEDRCLDIPTATFVVAGIAFSLYTIEYFLFGNFVGF